MKSALSALAGAALLATPFALTSSTASAQETIEMTSAFPQSLPVLGTGALDFVKKINGISGEVEFKHFDPGKLVPTLEALDAISSGSVDAGFMTPGYWQGKMATASLFSAVPFGPEAGEFLAWILYDDGAKLWQEMYDKNGYNVKVLPCGVIAPETSGWFRKEIKTLDDLKGLNMRFFGLGAKVMEKLGVSTSLLAAGDIFPALERGSIDATEFSMPVIDARLGFFKIAKYNYFPGWHQPATMFELLINKDKWDSLSDKAKKQIEIACLANISTTFAEGEAINYSSMVENAEKRGVIIKRWPAEILTAYEKAWGEVVTEIAAKDPMFKAVWDDLTKFRKGYKVWSDNIYLPRPR
ncbi:MAG: TRAP transporter substrate-binding protein [Neomegalonema sp.]|nr:TRAP transporter substrate-binding protein [Neomegalonema sp.]